MTIVNHAAVGAVIALYVKQPALAVPLAFLSHFIMDGLPHFGYDGYEEALKHKLTILYVVLDLIGWSVFIWIALNSQFSPLVYVCAFAGVLPDVIQSFRHFIIEKRGKIRTKSLFSQFHTRYHNHISGKLRPLGFVVELLAFLLLINLIIYLR